MALTAKQEAFSQAIADGKNQSEAYRSAYNAEKMKPETIWQKASVLMSDGKVAARVEELRAKLAEKQLWTREDSVRELQKVLADGGSVAVSAVKELNAMHGFNAPIKQEITGKDGGPLESTVSIKPHPELSPEQWAAAFGPK